MKKKLQLLLLLCLATITVKAQYKVSSTTVDYIAYLDATAPHIIGHDAPLPRFGEWIKGKQTKEFEPGKVYVIDFWATWCGPCITAMPHISRLASKYKNITFSAINVFESYGNMGKSKDEIKAFVDGLGKKMNINVALGDTDHTIHDWLKDYNQSYIPTTFIIDGNKKIAWIGHPSDLDTVLKKITKKTWNIEKESSIRKYADTLRHRIEALDSIVSSKVRRYQAKYNDLNDMGFPDSTLMVINEMVNKDSVLKFAPSTAHYTFAALLIKDPHQAYEFGKAAIVSSPFGSYAYGSIISAVRDDSRKLSTPAEIYLLGAECYEVKINRNPGASIVMRAKEYHEMADWYRLGGDKLKAIVTEKKAIKLWEKELKAGSN